MKFKVGDVVISVGNSVWIDRPMTVQDADNEYCILCLHPTRGVGGFIEDHLLHIDIYNSPLYKAME